MEAVRVVLRDGAARQNPAGVPGPGDRDTAGLAPAPGLADLPGLIERTRATGLRVELAQTGEPGD